MIGILDWRIRSLDLLQPKLNSSARSVRGNAFALRGRAGEQSFDRSKFLEEVIKPLAHR